MVASGHQHRGGRGRDGAEGKGYALHHMITAGDLGYAAWRDGGFTVHDISDRSAPKLLGHINASPPYPGGSHTPLPLPGRDLAVVADESNADNCAKGIFHTRCWKFAYRTIPCLSRPCRRPRTATTAAWAVSGRTICTRTGPAPSSRRILSSPRITMRGCASSTSRISSHRRKLLTGFSRCRRNWLTHGPIRGADLKRLCLTERDHLPERLERRDERPGIRRLRRYRTRLYS